MKTDTQRLTALTHPLPESVLPMSVYKSAYKFMPIPIVLLDITLNIIDCNDLFISMIQKKNKAEVIAVHLPTILSSKSLTLTQKSIWGTSQQLLLEKGCLASLLQGFNDLTQKRYQVAFSFSILF